MGFVFIYLSGGLICEDELEICGAILEKEIPDKILKSTEGFIVAFPKNTPAIKGGEAVEYQGRKKSRTTNALFLTDRQGLPLAMSEPVSGNHNDLFDIEVQFEVVTATLDRADIKTEGLFLNADAGFDSKDFRRACARRDINTNICFNKRNGSVDDRDEYFDRDLYDQRYAVERTNAWIDSFRSLLNRFDTTIESWKGFNYLSFIVIALKRFKPKKFIEVSS